MGQTIEKVRKEVHSLVGALHTHCQICVQKDRRVQGKSFIHLMGDLHHIWGRSRNPNDIRESVIGVLPVCLYHHNQYPPLLSVYEYRRRPEHWDLLFDSWWRVVLTYSEYDIGEDLHRFVSDTLVNLDNERVTEIFLSGREI